MGIFDDIVQAIAAIPNLIDKSFERANDPFIADEQASDVLGDLIEDLQPADELAAVLVDASEEFVQSDLEETGEVTPDNVEAVLDNTEGAGAGLFLGLASINTILEAASLGQLDAQEEFLIQAATVFGFDDLVGREIKARLQAGFDPALEAKVRKEHRPRFGALEDFVEANLRSKAQGTELDPENMDIPDDVTSLFHPDDFGWLENMDVYGTRPDQTELFEFVGLAHLEPEEILEEAPQKGVIPSQQAVLQALELSGQPEDVKEVFRQTRDAIPFSQDIYQEKTRLGEAIFEIDQKVLNNALGPDEAVALVESDIRELIVSVDAEGELPPGIAEEPDPAEIVLDELRRKWSLMSSLPPDPPSQADIEAWYEKGIINTQEFNSLYNRFGSTREAFFNYLVESSIDKGADEIQRQFALGRISGSEARSQLGLIGFSQRETAEILDGADPDSIVQDRLTAESGAGSLDVSLATEIGPARSAVLRQVGIGTLQALSEASVEDLRAVTGMTDNEAQTAIQSAQTILAGSQ